MDVKYHHLTKEDRIFLRIMLEKRYSKAKVAKPLALTVLLFIGKLSVTVARIGTARRSIMRVS